jgi:hypothetical protein
VDDLEGPYPPGDLEALKHCSFISLADLKMTRTNKNDGINSLPSGGELENAEPAD